MKTSYPSTTRCYTKNLPRGIRGGFLCYSIFVKIVICGSMSFAKEMLDAKRHLEAKGHACEMPEGAERYAMQRIVAVGGSEGARRKIENDLIKGHYRKIKDADAILVLNYTKNGVENYLGGNSFLEMGFAHILDKPIFLLHDIPAIPTMQEEVEAMRPVILHGNLEMIPSAVAIVQAR